MEDFFNSPVNSSVKIQNLLGSRLVREGGGQFEVTWPSDEA